MSSIESINPRKYAVYRRHNLQITWRNRIFVVLLPSNKFQVGAINSLCQILELFSRSTDFWRRSKVDEREESRACSGYSSSAPRQYSSLILLLACRRLKRERSELRDRVNLQFEPNYDLDLSSTKTRETSSLVSLCRYMDNITHPLIITMDTEDTLYSDDMKIDVVPVWKWLIV